MAVITRACLFCGGVVTISSSPSRTGRGKFCSRECLYNSMAASPANRLEGVLYDPEDEALIGKYRWKIHTTGYVVRRNYKNGVSHIIPLHREVMGAVSGQIVDHINRNKLDNRRSNLRFVNWRQSALNRSSTDRAKYYYFNKRKQRWTVDAPRFGVRGKPFRTEQEAKGFVDGWQKNLYGKDYLYYINEKENL